MCGILALIKFGGNIDLKTATMCLSMLNPRGPDTSSFQVERINDNTELFMGFTRLAIMDTSNAGVQPFNDIKSNIVICNGEIYNYNELASKYQIKLKSSCDCEVILPLFTKVGMYTMVKELDAEFATVVFSKQNNRLYAARDRYGVRPLYYGYNNETKTIGFASELKALHPIMEFVVQVDPASIMSIDFSKVNLSDPISKAIESEKYIHYNLFFPHYGNNNIEWCHYNIHKLLTDAVAKRLHADRPIGFLLSGGLDSSLIVAIASKILGPDKITCFSIGINGSPDVAAAKVVCEYLGITKHHIVPFDVETGIANLNDVIRAIETYDITTIRASTPQYIMAKYIQANTDCRVLFSGEGSDEIHGSYRYFRDAPDTESFHWETVRLLSELYMFDNQRTDRTMASNGLEVRIPFLDHAYVEFVMSINPGLLMYKSGQMEKQLVRDSFKGILPDQILYRSKEAFSDAVSNNEVNWATSIQELAASELTESDLMDSNYTHNKPRTFDAVYFRKIFDTVYPGRANVISHYWLPRFQKSKVNDPSARVLDCY